VGEKARERDGEGEAKTQGAAQGERVRARNAGPHNLGRGFFNEGARQSVGDRGELQKNGRRLGERSSGERKKSLGIPHWGKVLGSAEFLWKNEGATGLSNFFKAIEE